MSFISTVTVQVRMDHVLKQSAEAVFKSMGLNMSSAFNLFCVQTINQGRLPFAVVPAVPTRTLNAIQEAKDIAAHPENYKGYSDWDELMENLNA